MAIAKKKKNSANKEGKLNAEARKYMANQKKQMDRDWKSGICLLTAQN